MECVFLGFMLMDQIVFSGVDVSMNLYGWKMSRRHGSFCVVRIFH